jgi:Xaa-Pro aminopeptidase
MADILHDFGCDTEAIGIELPEGDCPSFLTGFASCLREKLPRVCWRDASGLLSRLRMIKSSLEIEKIRRAVEITQNAIAEAFDTFREGVTERKMAGAVAASMARQCPDSAVNHPWFIFVHADGKSPIGWDGMFSDYALRKGDCLYIDCGFVYRGYTADMIRIFAMGEPTKEKRTAYECVRLVNRQIRKAIRPGVSCGELNRIYRDTVLKAGFHHEWDAMTECGFLYAGHGIGLTVHEPPFINAAAEDILCAGMTLSIEPDVFFRLPVGENTIALKPEENVLVTADGCERLSTISDDLWVRE